MKYECCGQLSIFDFINDDKLPKLDDIINLIRSKFGLDFFTEEFQGCIEYVHEFSKTKRSKLEIHDSKYYGEEKRFVSVNYCKMTGDCHGFGCPCDDIDEVYECVEMAIRYDNESQNKKDKKIMMNTYDSFDECYVTGKYTDQICDICPHREDCSGYDGDDDDED